jgi:NADPH:quinone reductase-like Zn-dependent oxidoreductase
MKALFYEQFGGPLQVGELPDPVPADDGVVIEVRACGGLSERSAWLAGT